MYVNNYILQKLYIIRNKNRSKNIYNKILVIYIYPLEIVYFSLLYKKKKKITNVFNVIDLFKLINVKTFMSFIEVFCYHYFSEL